MYTLMTNVIARHSPLAQLGQVDLRRMMTTSVLYLYRNMPACRVISEPQLLGSRSGIYLFVDPFLIALSDGLPQLGLEVSPSLTVQMRFGQIRL